jgi:AcrR family transcriptional regulator
MNMMSETLTAAPEASENAAATAPIEAITAKVRPDRRQNILDASQRLFARYGFHAVTIRQIAAEAKVPLALVGYYFGQKQELYDAIFAHWSGTVAQRSVDLSEALTAEKGQQLQRIVSAMVVPVVRMRGSAQGESSRSKAWKKIAPFANFWIRYPPNLLMRYTAHSRTSIRRLRRRKRRGATSLHWARCCII